MAAIKSESLAALRRNPHIDLEGETPPPIPMMLGGLQMAARVAMPTPISTPEEQDITAMVSADVLLRVSKAEKGQTP